MMDFVTATKMNKYDVDKINEALGKACDAIQMGYIAIANSGTTLFPQDDAPAASLSFNLMGWMHLQRVVEIDPKNPVALSLLCSLELLEGNKREARALLNRLSDCKSSDRTSLTLGSIINQEIAKEAQDMRLDKILHKQFRVLQKIKRNHE